MSREIDHEKISKAFPIEFRHTVAKKIKETYHGENGRYFLNVFTYGDRHTTIPLELGEINDLYPPNIAVLDWIMEHCDPEKDIILDYGCGIGTNVFISIGFQNLWI